MEKFCIDSDEFMSFLLATNTDLDGAVDDEMFAIVPGSDNFMVD